MTVPYKNLGYGSLNQTSRRDFACKYDVGSSSNHGDVASRILGEQLSKTPDMKGPFQGLVLRVDEEDVPAFSWRNLLAATGVRPKRWVVKVRIPELHCYLPMPEYYVEEISDDKTDLKKTKKDNKQYIMTDMHPTYAPRTEGMPRPAVNDVVWCSEINGKWWVIDLDGDGNASTVVSSPVRAGTGGGTTGTPGSGAAANPPSADSQLSPSTPQNVDKTEAEKFIARINAHHGRQIIDPSKATDFVKWDIKTETINGIEITLQKDELANYLNFVKTFQDTYKNLTGKDIKVKHSKTEAFRLNKLGGGAFFSESKTGQHLTGNAIDVSFAASGLVVGSKDSDKTRANISFFIQQAMAFGYRGFGVGKNIVHIDRRSGNMFWTYSKLKDEAGNQLKGKFNTIKRDIELNGRSAMPIPQEWRDALAAFPDVKDFMANAPNHAANAFLARTFKKEDLV